MTIEFTVPERSYAAWPNSIRSAFEPARTVETGNLCLSLRTQGDPLMAISLALFKRSAALSPARLLVHGVAGIGKTTLAAGSEKPVFLLTENGLGTLDLPHFPPGEKLCRGD